MSLATALEKRGLLKDEYSIKDIRPYDLMTGAIQVGIRDGRPRPSVRRAWMWSERGNRRLARRLEEKIRGRKDQGPFLQVGSLVTIDPALGQHFVLTDMTIPQARREGFFEIASLSESGIRDSLRIQRGVFENARGIFTLSEWTKSSIVEDFGIPESRVHVVYAGSNLTIPDGVSAVRNPREILFVGIDWERKGGPLLLKAFRMLREQMPDLALTIVGCNPPVSDPGVSVVGYLDKRSEADLRKLAVCYLRSSCFCLPSLFDPFPNAIIEAASTGLPAVAIDNGSRREAVIDGTTGRLAPDASAEALAEALLWTVSETDRNRRLGEAARAHAAREFTWERVTERIQQTVAACAG